MEPLAVAASRLAERTGDLERLDERRDRPEERLPREALRVEGRGDVGRRGRPELDARPRGDEPHDGVPRLGDDEPPLSGDRDAGRRAKPRVGPPAVREARAVPHQRPCAGTRPDLDNPAAVVRHVDGAVGRHRHADRAHQAVRRHRQRSDSGRRRDHPHYARAGLRHVDVAGVVHRDAARRVEDLVRDVADGAVGLDRADAIVVRVGDDDPAAAIDRDADRPVEVAGERRDAAVERDSPDGVRARVGDVEDATAIDRKP